MSNDFSAALQAHFAKPAAHKDEPAGDTFGQFTRLIRDVTGLDEEAIERQSALQDLGLSSLALVELTVRAEERFKVRFDEGTVLNFTTVGDVVDFIDAQA